MTEPIEGDPAWELSNLVREEVNDYVDRFKRVEAEQAAEEDEDAEEEKAEEGGDGEPSA